MLTAFTLGEFDYAEVNASGNASRVDLPSMASVQERVHVYIGNGEVRLDAITAIHGSMRVVGDSPPALSLVTELTGGLDVSNATLDLPNLTTIEALELYVNEGATVTLGGAEAVLGGKFMNIVSGGTLNLPAVTELSDVSITIGTGGTLNAPLLNAMRAANLLTRVEIGSEGNLSLPVETMTNVELWTNNGGHLELPLLTQFEWRDHCLGVPALDARDGGATISLPALQTIVVDSGGRCAPFYDPLGIQAAAGGSISLPELVTIELGAGGEGETAYADRLSINAAGEAAQIDVSKLATFPVDRVIFTNDADGVILRP